MGWDLRALDGGELAKLVADGQSSRVGIAVQPIQVVFSGRVAAPLPASNDRVVQVTFSDGPLWASVLADMTLFVGTSAGAYDVGMVRVRKAATSSILYISECSDVAWAVGQYLTVVEDFGIWARHLRITGTDPFVVFMDWDVAYSDQHLNCDPVPVLGAHVVKKLTGATVQVTGFDAGDSWVRGSTITGYSWAAPGASATAGMSTATPTITYNVAGWYRVSCEVTAANSKKFRGFRRVYVYDDAHPPLWAQELTACEGDAGRGGWSFRVVVHADATLAQIRNRALIIAFAEDVYGSAEGSVGIIKDRENILAIGWIVGESIVYDPVHGTVEFTVEGAHSLIEKVTGFPSGVKDVGPAVPASWLEMQNMKVDDALWHFLHWRSTCTRMMDIFPPGTGVPIGLVNSGLATLWQQVQEIGARTIKASPCCDHLGRLYVKTDSQFLPVGDRAGIPVILTIQPNYWRESIQIERQVIAPVGRVDLAGVAWSNATQKGTPYFSLAPGHTMKQYGGVQAEDRLALTSQAQANGLAGLILGHANNPYPSILVRFAMNLRALDVCPWQYAMISIAAGDNPRGIALTNFKIIPRRVSYSYQGGAEGGVLLTDVTFEGYTTAESSCDGDIPASPPEPAPPPPPPEPPPLPEPPPETLAEPQLVVVRSADGPHKIYKTENFGAASPTWADWTGSLTNINRIEIDQTNLYLYAQCNSGLYRADLTSVSASWAQVVNFASPPAGVRWISPQGMKVSQSGHIGIPATAVDTCAPCGANNNRPVMIQVSPRGVVTALQSQYGCDPAHCCPWPGHDFVSYWNQGVYYQYHMAVRGNTLTMCGDCRGPMVGGYNHFCQATAGAGSYTQSSETPPNWGALHEMVDLGGGAIIGRYNGDGHLYSVPIGAAVWTDISPVGWTGASIYGLDADAQGALAVFTRNDYLYKSTGGQFTQVVYRGDVPGGFSGFFGHCSCYSGDVDQWFLPAGNCVWHTLDAGGTWLNKKGDLPNRGYHEARACWSWAP
jgi:hypothetical protein